MWEYAQVSVRDFEQVREWQRGANEPQIQAYRTKDNNSSIEFVSKTNVKVAYLRLGGLVIGPSCETFEQLLDGH